MWYKVFIDMDMKELYYGAQAACYFHAVCFGRQKYILQLSPCPNKESFIATIPSYFFPSYAKKIKEERENYSSSI